MSPCDDSPAVFRGPVPGDAGVLPGRPPRPGSRPPRRRSAIAPALLLASGAAAVAVGAPPAGSGAGVEPGRHCFEAAAVDCDALGPWAYCRAAGTEDEPDSERLGPETAAAFHGRVREVFDLPDDLPEERVSAWTAWRCMDGEVWACIAGANLPCRERADTRREPSEPLRSYCRDHPEADVIPAAVTGRATVYSWRCAGGRPEVAAQWSEPDPRGFHGGIWRRIDPPDAPLAGSEAR